MSGACDNFILEDQSCEWFELVQYVESFDMGINFLEGPPGPPGPAGEAIFIPSVSEDGVLSWTNTAGLPNPDPIDLSGPAGTTDYSDLTNKPSINGITLSGNKTTAELLISFSAADVGLGNVANERQYSAQNPPPYPVTSVAGKVGAISLLPPDVGLGNVANERQYSATNPPPYPITSVNGKTGAVKLDAAGVGALPDTLAHITETGTSNGWAYYKLNNNVVIATRVVADTLEHYLTVNGFYGYYFANIATPFTMRNAEYYVGCDWSIGNGFSLPAGRLSMTTTKFNAYALSTSAGSNSVRLRMTLIGEIQT